MKGFRQRTWKRFGDRYRHIQEQFDKNNNEYRGMYGFGG